MELGRAAGAVAGLDRAAEEWMGRWRGNAVADRAFYAASALGDHGQLWLMLAAARGLRGSPRHERAALRAWGAVAVESVLVNVVIKSLFRRKRPAWEVARPLPLRKPRTSSFPSGHATSAFTAAVLLSEDDQLAPVYFALATAVAASRAYVKIHHASDVVAGAALGLGLGWLGRRLVPLDPADQRE